MQYYIRIRGKSFGPFDENQLLEMKTKGKLSRATEVSSNRTEWIQAEELEFLYQKVPEPLRQNVSEPALTSSPNAAQEQADWFYSVNGTEGYGPVTSAGIIQMIQGGRLNGESYLWKQGQNAQYLENVQPFSAYVGTQTFPASTSPSVTSTASSRGVITNDPIPAAIVEPLAKSTGWLMFLKIIFLIWLIGFGINSLTSLIMLISASHKIPGALASILILFSLVAFGGLFFLFLRIFLTFWKYHVEIQKTVYSRSEIDLHQSLDLLSTLWRAIGHLVIVFLSIVALGILVVVVMMSLAPSMF